MQRVAAWLTILILGTGASAYVINTFLYLTPPNPVKLQLLSRIHRLEDPYFTQNWHLFAPNPIKSNFVLTIRCRVGDRITPWHDPYTPLLAAHHRNRLTPLGKTLRISQNAVLTFLGRNTNEWLPIVCKRKPDLPTCRGTDTATKKQREIGRYLLQHLASTVCDDLVGAGMTTAVQSRILLHSPPPFSRRHQPSEAGSTSYFTLPWAPYQSSRKGSREDTDATSTRLAND